MYGKGKLVPTLTVDKNGKLTTVYKAPKTHPSARPIPPQFDHLGAYAEAESAADLVAGLLSAAASVGMLDVRSESEKRHIRANFLHYESDFRKELLVLLKQPDKGVATEIARMIRRMESPTLIMESQSFLRELDETDLESGVALVHSLRQYEQLPWAADYSDADDELRAKCLAIMNTACAVKSMSADDPSTLSSVMHGGGSKTSYIINDQQLVQAVVDNPDGAPEIIRIIREYRIGSYRAVQAVLDGVTTPLVEGAL